MFIYLINISDTDLYKIGVSKNPQTRLKFLQTANSKQLNLICEFNTKFDYKLEKFVHNYFKTQKELGEWFLLKEENIKEFIPTCIKGEGIFDLLKKNNNYVNDNL